MAPVMAPGRSLGRIVLFCCLRSAAADAMSGLIFAAATVGGCYYILGLLLGMCAWNWQHIFERPKKIQKDEFKNLENKQGWNWDWCFVFKVHEAPALSETPPLSRQQRSTGTGP